MDPLRLMMLLHLHNPRQGPGSTQHTQLALQIAGLNHDLPLKVADIGCGTGAQTLVLAKKLRGEILAVDIFEEFLTQLKQQASTLSLSARITTLKASMKKLPFFPQELDVIWSEGAAYNMGFRNAVSYWGRFLKPKGILALSEISWTTNSRPKDLEKFWLTEYPEIDTIPNKIAVLEQQGYQLLGVFTLPPLCWIDNYYLPLINSHHFFLKRYGQFVQAQEIVDYDNKEFSLYQKYQEFYSYGFYIAQKKNP